MGDGERRFDADFERTGRSRGGHCGGEASAAPGGSEDDAVLGEPGEQWEMVSDDCGRRRQRWLNSHARHFFSLLFFFFLCCALLMYMYSKHFCK